MSPAPVVARSPFRLLVLLALLSPIPSLAAPVQPAACTADPAFASAPEARELSACELGVMLEWELPVHWGSGLFGRFNVYRSAVSCADALAQATPVASCLTTTRYVDIPPGAGTWYYSIEAETAEPCSSGAPCNGGRRARGPCAVVVDGKVAGGSCPPAGTMCTAINPPVPLSCPGSVTSTISANVSSVTSWPGCSPLGTARSFGLREKVYRIVIDTPTVLDAVLSNTGARNLDLFLLSSCNENACILSGDNAIHAPWLPAGVYFLVVDGASTDAGSFTLTLSCGTSLDCDPPTGDLACGGTVAGDTSAGSLLVADWRGIAGSWGGRESSWRFVNPAQQDVTFALSGQPAGMALFVTEGCSEAAPLAGGSATATLRALPPGTYDVTVDAPSGVAGPYSLSTTCLASSGPARWTACEEGLGATTPSTSTATVWNFDDRAYCVSNPGSEGNPGCTFALWAGGTCGTELRFELTDVETATLRVFDESRGLWLPVRATSPGGLSVGPAAEVSWQDCLGTNPATNGQVTTLVAGDGTTLCGTYRLEIEDAGGFLWSLVSNCSGSGTAGVFPLHDSAAAAAAASSPRPQFTLSDLTTAGGCASLAAEVDVTNTGCTPASVVVTFAAGTGETASTTVGPVAPGATIVASQSLPLLTRSLTTITATVDPANAVAECSEATNPGCAAAASTRSLAVPADCTCLVPFSPIACGSTVAGSTVGGPNRNGWSCSGRNLSGPEAVYSFDLATPATVRASLSGAPAALDVLLTSGICDPSACVAWGESEAVAVLPAGRHFVVVDGVGGASGSFSLTLECLSPAACGTPLTLACDALVTGHTALGTNLRSTYSCNAAPLTGPEIVYRFVNDQVRDVVFDVESLSDADLELVLLSDCAAATCVATGDRRIRVRSLPAGTYTLVVDAPGGQSGPYELAVSCDPLGPFLHETCFESGAAGYSTSGFWHRVVAPTTISIPAPVNTFATYPDSPPNLPPAPEGLAGFWYGQDSTGTFIGPYPSQSAGSGGTSLSPNSGRLVSPTIDLTGHPTATLEFLSWWEIEGVDTPSYDLMTIQVSTDGGAIWTDVAQLNPIDDVNGQPNIPYGSDGFNTPIRSVLEPYIDLSDWGDRPIRLGFRFSTEDEVFNAYRGWFLDCVRVFSGTVPPPVIDRVEPSCDVVPSTLLTITGEHFLAGATVRFNGLLASQAAVISSTSILAKLPASGLTCPGPISVTVTNPTGTVAAKANALLCGNGSCSASLLLDAGADRTVCAGSSTLLGGSPTASGGTPPYGYSWSPTTGLSDPAAANPSATPAATTTYTVVLTDSVGGTKSDSVVLTVVPLPTPTIAGPTTVCSGGSVTLDAGGGYAAYAWSTGATTRTITVSPASTTTYSVTVTDTGGCSGTDSHDVTVAGGLSPVITGPTSVCAGGSVTLDAGAGFASYAWSTGATTRTITISPASTTSYSVTVTDAGGCSGTDSHDVAVDPLPTPTITGPTSLCSGGSITLDAGAGYASYSWSTGATTRTITVSPTSSASYSVTVTDAGGCSGSDSHGVTVSGALSPVIAGPTSLCAGSSVTLDAGAGYASYAWSTGANTRTITVSPAANSTYSVTVTDAGGCSGSDSHSVTVFLTPTPAITGPSTVCAGGSVTLDAGAGYSSYAWSTGATTRTIAVSPAASATYSVTVTTARECSGSDSHDVTVNPLPTPAISGPTSVCAGGSVTLDAGAGYAAYAWSTGAGTRTITVSPASTTTYSVNVTDAAGCSGSDSHDVTIGGGAAVAITGGDPICPGGSATLTATAGFVSYLWSNGATTPSITVSPAATTTYGVTAVDGAGCSGSASKTVDVFPVPTASAGPDRLLGCSPSFVTLAGAVSGGSGSLSWQWSPSAGLSDPLALQPTANAAGSWTLTVIDTVTGCSASDSVTVTAASTPPTVTAGPDRLLDCTTTVVQLEGDTSASSFTFSWSPTAGLVNPGSIRPFCNQPGTYTLTVTDSATGCSASDSVVVTRNTALPVAGFTSSATTVCILQPVSFQSSSTGQLSLLWDFGTGTDFSSDPNPTFAWSAPGSYTVRLTATNNCGTDSETVVITVNPVPVSNFSYTGSGGKLCRGNAVNFTDTSTNAPIAWSWNFGDPASGAANTSTLQNPSHTYATDGIWTVTLTATNACGVGTTISKTVTIVASCNTNCSANSNSLNCSGGTPVVQTGDTSVDADNVNTSFYDCRGDVAYGGPNRTYDLNFQDGSTYLVTLTQTGPPGYDLDLLLSDRCNPYNCVAWGDTELRFDDRGGSDYFLVVDGRGGSAGAYELSVTCLGPTQTASCTAPTFTGVAAATDANACAAGGITVTWPATAAWGLDAAGLPCSGGTYEVLRAPASSPTAFLTVGSGIAGTSFTDTSAIFGTPYLYKVNAINGCCGIPALTPGTAAAVDRSQASPVFAGIVSATDADGCLKSGVQVSWNAASDFGSPTGTYRVRRSPYVDCSSSTIVATGLTSLSYLDTTGLPNTNYYYRVEAVSSCGAAADGGTGCLAARDIQGIGVEPSATDLNPAATPLRVAEPGPGSPVSLTWEAGSNLYSVYRGTLAALATGDYDHQSTGACDVPVPTATVDPGDGDFYFLVTGKPCAGAVESSYGRNSIGQERPNAAAASGSGCP